MAALLALLPMLIQLGPTLITIGVDAYDLIGKVTGALKGATAELTPAQSAQLDAHIATLEASPWWQNQP